MKIRELMTRDPDVLTPDATVGEAARLKNQVLDFHVFKQAEFARIGHRAGNRDGSVRFKIIAMVNNYVVVWLQSNVFIAVCIFKRVEQAE